jgi:hypothetical protein
VLNNINIIFVFIVFHYSSYYLWFKFELSKKIQLNEEKCSKIKHVVPGTLGLEDGRKILVEEKTNKLC